MKLQRCSIFANSTGRRCKHKTSHQIINKYMCTTHAKIIFGSSALYIQKLYIGYRTRRKLKNIFYKLPDEIQDKILGYIKQPYYIKNYHKCIVKILDNRNIELFGNDQFNTNSQMNNNYDYYHNIISIYRLYCKYMSIIPTKMLFSLYNRQSTIVYMYRTFIRDIFIDNNNNEEILIRRTIGSQLLNQLLAFKSDYEYYVNPPAYQLNYLFI